MSARARIACRSCHTAAVGREQEGWSAPTRVVPKILSLYRARGIDVQAILHELGLPAEAETTAETALAPVAFDRLLAAGAVALSDPLLAVHLPERLSWDDYHVAELAARASDSLREAFERVVRFGSLFYAHLSFRAEAEGDTFVLAQRLRVGPPGLRYGNEYGVATTLFHARCLGGADIVPRAVFFAHPAPPEVEALQTFFGGAELRFDRAESGLVLDARDVARPCAARDPRLLRTAEALAERALSARPPERDFAEQVASTIQEALPGGAPDAAEVARSMHMSLRTLQRRLDERGTTFSRVLEDTRRTVALQLLEHEALSLQAIAPQVGFADAAAFSRAFRRWTGRTPGAYRRARDR